MSPTITRRFVGAIALLGTLAVLATALACGETAPVNAGFGGGPSTGGQTQLLP